MTPLEQYPAARRIVYGFLWVAGLFLVAAQLSVAAVDDWTQPKWLTAALAVFPAVSAYVGFQARANTPPTPPPVDPDRLRAIDGTIGGVRTDPTDPGFLRFSAEPVPRLADPWRAPENACPICYRRLSWWGIGWCRRCPGRRVVFT